MARSSSLARTLYRWSAFVAIPGTLWSAFEMYVLTLSGSQMLFYSIAHTAPILVLVLLAGLLALLLWGIQSLAAVLITSYQIKISLHKPALSSFAVLAALHLVQLVGYEAWSNSSARIFFCLEGIVVSALLIYLFASSFFLAQDTPVGM